MVWFWVVSMVPEDSEVVVVVVEGGAEDERLPEKPTERC